MDTDALAILLVFGLLFGVAAGVVSSSKGGSGFLGFVLGFLLGPFGLIISFFIGSEAGKETRSVAYGNAKKCPMCAELVKREARICRFCGHNFVSPEDASLSAAEATAAPVAPSPQTAQEDRDDSNTAFNAGLWLMAVAGMLVLFFIVADLARRTGWASSENSNVIDLDEQALLDAPEKPKALAKAKGKTSRRKAAKATVAEKAPNPTGAEATPQSLCWQDYCPCEPPQGGPDEFLCRRLRAGLPVDDEQLSIGAGMRDARRQIDEFDWNEPTY